EYIYPYGDLNYTYYDGTWAPKMIAKVWPKGENSGDPSKLQEVKNPYVIPYPVAEDDDRICFYLSKERLSDAEKAKRRYYVINIDDLFDNGQYRKTDIKVTNDKNMYPGFNKYNWLSEDSYSSNLPRKTGDVFIMRMAEVYLIAAEANQQLGNGGKAAEYLNVLKKRAARNDASYNAMKLSNATQNDVMDEYARELCGEYQRWVLMKRHKDSFKQRLAVGNPRAAENFDENKHYLRPISFNFLSQIDNAEEYGNNGY
ncbi:RagB/SusD family nutrient uptake outer membrane protein, partial [Escherichia coli]|nr:RagB/SusD family nutrient uptake outer membrane protein [Escherichia coli]